MAHPVPALPDVGGRDSRDSEMSDMWRLTVGAWCRDGLVPRVKPVRPVPTVMPEDPSPSGPAGAERYNCIYFIYLYLFHIFVFISYICIYFIYL